MKNEKLITIHSSLDDQVYRFESCAILQAVRILAIMVLDIEVIQEKRK